MSRAPRKSRPKKVTKEVAVEPSSVTFPSPEKVAASVAKVMGRPSKYSAAFCATVVSCGQDGMSRTEIACELGVHRSTLLEWEKAHAEFKEAMELAIQYAQAFWERMGRNGCREGKEFNATAFIFQMKNRFGDEYRDQQHHNHTNSFNMAEFWERIPQKLPRPTYED